MPVAICIYPANDLLGMRSEAVNIDLQIITFHLNTGVTKIAFHSTHKILVPCFVLTTSLHFIKHNRKMQYF